MIKETFKPVRGYEGLYEVSNFGNVKSLQRTCTSKENSLRKVQEKVLKLFTVKGYWYVCLNNKGLKQYRVHKLVAEAFIPNSNKLPYVNHIDGDKLNNLVTNLEWCTPKENAIHASLNGLLKGRKGEAHHNNKLTQADVDRIRLRLLTETGRNIAKSYGVSEGIISLIKNNKNWIK